jgi:hypothetical protein
VVRAYGPLLVVAVVLLGLLGGCGYLVDRQLRKPSAYEGDLGSGAVFSKVCGRWGRKSFPQAAALSAKGPHPVEVFLTSKGQNSYHPAYLRTNGNPLPAAWRERDERKIQLIACASQSGTGEQVRSCHFDEQSPREVPMYAAEYEVKVYEARTAKLVGSGTIRAGRDTGCPSLHVYREDDTPKLYSTPTFEQYRETIGSHVG